MIGFRVDANKEVATGHLIRCITIALECMQNGKTCIFYLAENKETARLEELGIPYRILNSKWDALETEMESMRTWIKMDRLEWLVVDSYQVTQKYLIFLQECVPVLYMDDMGKEIYPVSALVHYAQWKDDDSFAKKYDKTNVTLFLGMDYIPLRREFEEINFMEKESGCEKTILITTGGTDTYNITGKLLKNVENYKELQNFNYHVIVGNMNENEGLLRKLAKENTRIQLHKNIKNIGEFMKNCEMAVSAGGTTLFELCATGTPTVCFSFAENQQAFAEEMGKRRFMLYAGDARYDTEIADKICGNLVVLAGDEELRTSYSKRVRKLVDGRGAKRVADFLTIPK